VWIKGENAVGIGGFSPIASGTPLETPGTPTIGTAIGKLTVSWAATAGASAYEVWMGTTNDSAQAVQRESNVTGLSVTISELSSDTTYYVWIKAKNSGGTSGFSPVASVAPITPPEAPTVTMGDGALAVSWTAVDGATAYEVWTGTTNDSASAAKYGADTRGLSVTITGLNNSTTYYVWIKAKNNGGGTSGFSPAASALGLPNPLVRPGNSQLTVSWTAVDGAAVYEVWTGTANDIASAAKYGADTRELSVTISGLDNGIVYYVWIKAKNSGGSSGFSPAASGMPSVLVYFYASLADYEGGGEEYEIAVPYNDVIDPLPAPPPAPTEDLIFGKWVYKETNETTSEFTVSTSVTADMYVYAVWVRKNQPLMGTELEDRKWAVDSVSSSSTTKYHYFWAESGSSYTVRWNDGWQGDGTRAGLVNVSAYWYDTNTSIFAAANYGYTNGKIFTATKNGFVMLKVSAYSNNSSYYGSYAIACADMDNPVPIIGAELAAAQWATNSVSSSSGTKYHYFWAESGSSYTVRWNDGWQGDGTKTGLVNVSAYWYDTNTSIFAAANYGYTNGKIFTATRSGFVMLKVSAYSNNSSYYGSYAISYQ
ncbi:MAG: fibronectin type III domain-containing protein, partial [Treponema sp.]|jgi:hypothetical protein|nr:fibronectin type III domain-containing protein [Treponema sp.]